MTNHKEEVMGLALALNRARNALRHAIVEAVKSLPLDVLESFNTSQRKVINFVASDGWGVWHSWECNVSADRLHLDLITHDDRGPSTSTGVDLPWDLFPVPPTIEELDLLGVLR